MALRVAINGFGRIGRNILRIIFENNIEEIELVAINNSHFIEALAHLIRFDSSYGKFEGCVEIEDDYLIVNKHPIKVFGERDINKLNWSNDDIDLVIESTGKYRTKELASKHLEAGAKKVIITAPSKGEDITIVMGVNEKEYDTNNHHIISNASCTTNCLAPVAKVLQEAYGINYGLMTTVHSYTQDQRLLDGTHKDLRRARTCTESIIPTTTGAAISVGNVIPELKGKINGMAMRVPTQTVSVVDGVFNLNHSTKVEEINTLFKEKSQNGLNGILGISEEPLVSVDYKKDTRSSIIDGLSTMMVGDKMAKIVAWYDNEWGYASRTVDLALLISKGMKS